MTDQQVDALGAEIAGVRVGGDYWGEQPLLPAEPYVLVRAAEPARPSPDRTQADGPVVHWSPTRQSGANHQGVAFQISGAYDPWHLVSGAKLVVAAASDEILLVAALRGVAVEPVGDGPFAEVGSPAGLRSALRSHLLAGGTPLDPFSGQPASIAALVELLALWRSLIDRNRGIGSGMGFSRWKRPTVEPLLWSGRPFRFLDRLGDTAAGEAVATWRSRISPRTLGVLNQRGVTLVEVEDGFIRSSGLGADCVPPLSIVVDRLGAHFDPSRPSELEMLLETAEIGPELLQRARALRERIVAGGISKYAVATETLAPRAGSGRQILVPGQVEDDRSVVSGSRVHSNLELLRRVRAEEPGARILYKPHPDVEAGHRTGAIPEAACLAVADEIVRDRPITTLIGEADAVHVNTSLAGFEALMRGKPVTTHGSPFYAGWGLTTDLGEALPRRTRRRSLDELVAATLILYPRYLDPVTRLPCSPEVLVDRLAAAAAPKDGMLVRARRAQGSLKRAAGSLLGR
ncbi:hypothetical protein HMF7854_05715 [Sphingomonas ginkgonis]|uniref:Beta-3-deoxy-D-manno-oct-2-ulosonic acid transferase n=1 Tax=Sphingomonas ginkgonis TaxID=2315330 RepID=A0A3R9YP27_9SPHN|nr:hypothetical protein HMF7854_05715 [Sphingomonas ginkgonis]